VKWVTKGKVTFSAPYRIISCVRGHEVWIASKDRYGCLGRELRTLQAAQEFAEAHRAKDTTSA
jgi:hypothetical protein